MTKKCKNKADRKMVKALNVVPYREILSGGTDEQET